jgi:hypothetical protein
VGGACKNDLVCTSDLKCAKALHQSDLDKCTVDFECEYGDCSILGVCLTYESDNDYPHSCSTNDDC